MFFGNSRLAEYVLNMCLIFGKIPTSTKCPPKVSIFYGEITIVGYKLTISLTHPVSQLLGF